LQSIEDFKTEKLLTDANGPAFIVKATIKGLELLYGILVTAKKILDVFEDIRDRQLSQTQPFYPEEAAKILRVSETKLQGMKDCGALIEGVHYWQEGRIVRYFPDFATKPLKAIRKETKEKSSAENTVTGNAQCAINPDY
jgi:hypothetical protein